jgi:hypothetical protein
MKKKISLWSLRSGLLIAGICFFLPLASVDCAGRTMMVYDGPSIVEEGYESLNDTKKKSALESMKPGISWRLETFAAIPVAAVIGIVVSFAAATPLVSYILPLFPLLTLLPYLLVVPLMSGESKYITFSAMYGSYLVIAGSIIGLIAAVLVIIFTRKRAT